MDKIMNWTLSKTYNEGHYAEFVKYLTLYHRGMVRGQLVADTAQVICDALNGMDVKPGAQYTRIMYGSDAGHGE
jgi:hypothetical protein